MTRSTRPFLTRRTAPRITGLEARLMFDAAAVATAIDTHDAAVDVHAIAPRPLAALPSAQALAPAAQATWTEALSKANEQLVALAQQPGFADLLRTAFGQAGTSQADFDRAVASVTQALLHGDLQVQVELRSNQDLHGVMGAYTAKGPDGKEHIYINADWVAGGRSAAEVQRVLLEELGHALDHHLNGSLDSRGDEGALFSALARGLHPTDSALASYSADVDRDRISLDGVSIDVEYSELSVPFVEGFLGQYVNNAHQPTNITTFWTEGIVAASFYQDSGTGQFTTQGNDIPGGIRLEFVDGTVVSFTGAINWRDTQGSTLYSFGFIVDAGTPNTTLPGGYVVNTHTTFGLELVGASKVYTDGQNISGNAATSGLLDALNAYLATVQANDPNGPVTVVSQTTSDTTPQITGSATLNLGTGEYLTVQVGGGSYYYFGAGDPLNSPELGMSGSNWTLNIGTPMALGTYSVTATITNSSYYTLSDTTSSELVITAPDGTAPTVTAGQTFNYAENRSAGTVVATVAATDNVGVTGFRFSASGSTTSADGYYTIASNGQVTITAAGAAAGVANNDYETSPNSFSLGVQARDAAGNWSGAVNISLNVTNVDEVPTAAADTIAATEDTLLNGNVTGNDTPSSDGGNSWSLVSNAAHGSVTVNANGTFSYTPAANFNGTDSFSYRITDGDGDTSTAVVTLNVASVDDLPTAVDDTIAATEDTLLNGNVSGNDTASGDGGNVYSRATNAAHGSVTVNADGTFSYTPAANFNGTDSFSYKVTDADGDTSIAVVTLNVASVDDQPTAANDTIAATEDTLLNGNVSGNDTASGDGGNVYSRAVDAAHGTVTMNTDGTFSYTPNANFNGTDSFSYTITDGDGDTSTAVVTLNVASVDDLPTAAADTLAATEDTLLNGNVSGNDTASGDGGNAYSRVTNAAHGSVTVNADGSFSYTPAANFHGTDSFSYKITDADGDTSVAVVTLNVASADDLPVAADDTIAGSEGAVLNDSVAGNDTASGDGGNTWTLGTQASQGTVTLNTDGSFTYTPSGNYHGLDSFTYTLTDADGSSSTATVVLDLANVDHQPVAADDTLAATEDSLLSGDVSGNDTGSLDGGNSWSLDSQAGHGTVTMNTDGTFSYTPTGDFNGTDSFSYTITDADGSTSTAVVTLNVASVDDLPTAADDTLAATEDTVLNGSVTANDTPSGDGGNSWSLDSQAGHGTVTMNTDGTFSYTPTGDFNGTDSFSYTITDADGSTSTAVVTLNVASVDDLPTAANDTLAATEDTVLNGSVTANDTPSGDGGNSWSLDSQAGHGTVTMNTDGTFSYTPNADFNGTDSFSYTLTDADGSTSTAVVTLNVASVDDLPTAANDTIAATEDTVLNGSVTANDTPSGDGGNSWSLDSQAGHGTVTMNTDGTFSYTPTGDFNGTDSFSYTITDADGSTSTAVVTLNVASVDDLPTAADDTLAATEDTVLNGSVTANDTPSGDGGNVYSRAVDAAHGAVTMNTDGTFSYTPNADFNGTDSFSYTLTDADGSTSTAVVTLNVASVDDLPTAANDTIAATEDTVLNGSVTANDTPSGDGGNSWSLDSQAGHGTVTMNTDGTFSYTPTGDFNGTDSFSYTITDADGSTSTAVVTLNVASVDDLPQAVNDSVQAGEDSPLTGNLRMNDSLSGDGGNTWSLAGPAGHGTVTVNADGTFSYSPAADFHGTDSFSYTLTDADGSTSTAVVTLTVAPANDAPVGGDPSNPDWSVADGRYQTTTPRDTPRHGVVGGSDVDGDTLGYTTGTAPAHGTVTLDPVSGEWVYTPAAGYLGRDSFVVLVDDGHGGSATVTVDVTVTPVNDPPVPGDSANPDWNAADGRYDTTTPRDTPRHGTIDAGDLNGDTLSFHTQTAPAHGTLTLDAATGAWVYTPAAGYVGNDSFVVLVDDGHGGSVPVTVQVGVTPVNDPPVPGDSANPDWNAADGRYDTTTPQGTPRHGTIDAGDLNGDSLVYSRGTAPAHGTLTLDAATGAWVYTPAAGFTGQDSFTVWVDDGHGGRVEVTVGVQVTPVNDPPQAGDTANPDWNPDNGRYETVTPQDQPRHGLIDAGDLNGDTLRFSPQVAPAHGSLALDAATGAWVYTPAAGFAGSDSFVVLVSDGRGGQVSVTVQVDVTPAPVVVVAPVVLPTAPGPRVVSPQPTPEPIPVAPPAPFDSAIRPVASFGEPPPVLLPQGALAIEPQLVVIESRPAEDIYTRPSGFQIMVSKATEPSLKAFHGVDDQVVPLGNVLNVQLPADTFVHTQVDETVTLQAQLADGRPLPGWLHFDGKAGTFEGLPPPNFHGDLAIRVVARDTRGREAVTMFRIKAGDRPTTQRGAGLSHQLMRGEAWAVGKAGWQAERATTVPRRG